MTDSLYAAGRSLDTGQWSHPLFSALFHSQCFIAIPSTAVGLTCREQVGWESEDKECALYSARTITLCISKDVYQEVKLLYVFN